MVTERTRVIQLDSYFDGGGGAAQLSDLFQSNVGVTKGNTAAAYSGGHAYLDPSQVESSRGTLANQLPMGPEGLRGVVIPRATMGGIPQGSRLHDTRNMEVVIDPHIPNQSSVVRLGDLTPATVQEATMSAAEITADPYDIHSLRLRGAAVMHNLSKTRMMEKQAMAAVPVPPPQMQIDYMNNQPVLAQPSVFMQGQQQPQYQQPLAQPQFAPPQPVQAFASPRPAPPLQSSLLAAIKPQPAPPPPAAPPMQFVDTRASTRGGPPRIGVILEVQHFGALEFRYHDVLIQDGFIVLVYDRLHTSSVKYFPPTIHDENARMAMNVTGTPDVYIVHTTGIQYVHEDYEYCVLTAEAGGQLQG